MFTLKGKYTDAIVYTKKADEKTVSQIVAMVDEPVTKDTTVRIMSDCHIGKNSTIGTTIRFHDTIERIVPNIVGVDIGCGIEMRKLKKDSSIDFEKLDKVINRNIPSGFKVHSRSTNIFNTELDDLIVSLPSDKIARIRKSVGTLGGGNHYIELAKDEDNEMWLSVHSGSRSLGFLVANHYQKLTKETPLMDSNQEKNFIDPIYTPLTGKAIEDYLHDMSIAQRFAELNRATMLDRIGEVMEWEFEDSFDSIHNYMDIENKIIRKGATSAQLGERLVIPLNMRDGSLICEGKGNEDWNFSAPHGAGRELSRTAAKKAINLSVYIEQMKDIYTTSVGSSTLDEAPDAYKPFEEIIENIQDTVKIIHHLRPLYNYKAH